jgi:polyhydroxyalkanoate synthase subunit PhaC
VEEHAGSWWPFWMQWLKDRSGKVTKSPAKLGSKKHPPGDPAPGRYVID